ncbi:MAG: HPF/RaiA family ribosome-associated protein [Kofleriaceae bacterium]
MQTPVDITYRDMQPSIALDATIERWADRLGRLEPRISHCTVVVERPHRKHRTGQQFHVRLEIAIPDRVIVVGRDAGHDQGHEDPYVAVGDAFRAARRQLQEAIEIRRGDVKLHA